MRPSAQRNVGIRPPSSIDSVSRERPLPMFVLRSLHDVSAGNAALQAGYLAKGGRENGILWSRSRYADFAPCAQPLSIRAVWGGAQQIHLDGRTIAVDDDTFLILNGAICATSIRASAPIETLTIYFR